MENKKREERSERKIFFIIAISLFFISIISAADYRFQNFSGTNLTVIHGDTGNLTVFGNISAANFDYNLFISTYNATYDAATASASSWLSSSGIIYNNTLSVKVGIGTANPLTIFHVNNLNNSLNASYFYQNTTLTTSSAYIGKFETFIDGNANGGSLIYLGYFNSLSGLDYGIYSDKGINYFEGETLFNQSVKLMSGSHLGVGISNETNPFAEAERWNYGVFKTKPPKTLVSELTIKSRSSADFMDSWGSYQTVINIGMLNNSYMDDYGIDFWDFPNYGDPGHISGMHNKTILNVPGTDIGLNNLGFNVNGSNTVTLNNTGFMLISNSSSSGFAASLGRNVTLNGGAVSANATETRWCDGAGGTIFDTGVECCALYGMTCLETWGDVPGGSVQVEMHQTCTSALTWNSAFIALCY